MNLFYQIFSLDWQDITQFKVMPHKKFEDFLLQVTANSCFNLALISLDRKLSMPSFA